MIVIGRLKSPIGDFNLPNFSHRSMIVITSRARPRPQAHGQDQKAWAVLNT